jgi:hypothetical protein
MRAIGKTFLIASVALCLPACEQVGDDTGTFRKAPVSNAGTQNRNEDTLLHAPPSAGDDDDDDCLIWDIKNDTDVDDATGNPVFELNGSDIRVGGQTTCVIEDGELSAVRVRGGDTEGVGPVLLTLRGNGLYAAEEADDPIMSFQAFNILDGAVSDHEVIVVSDANLSKATPYRKAMIGALVQGLCGSDGLP